MGESCITQSEANRLTGIDKYRVDDRQYTFPILGGELRIPLFSVDKKEEFCLDISRSRIQIKKTKYQTRSRNNIILVRIDLAGGPHRNPDFVEVTCPHIHLYRQEFDDRWAYPLPEIFNNPNDAWAVLMDFYRYCNVVQPPILLKELFI